MQKKFQIKDLTNLEQRYFNSNIKKNYILKLEYGIESVEDLLKENICHLYYYHSKEERITNVQLIAVPKQDDPIGSFAEIKFGIIQDKPYFGINYLNMINLTDFLQFMDKKYPERLNLMEEAVYEPYREKKRKEHSGLSLHRPAYPTYRRKE